ncbi:MAG: LD-carboxypeptidase [Alphaproteobacteria bacterium]|nr:LD-carboxypeptidase [Alphaproteobacteria bacterium]
MLKCFCFFSLLLLCNGCVEEPKRIGPEETTYGTFKDIDLDEISKRIAFLDMTVVAPGAGITEEHIRTMQILKEKYGVNIPLPAIANKSANYCADSVENRLKFIDEAIKSTHPIIWAMRGGFGTNMLMAEMDKWPVPKEKKVIVGFSDTTSLQLFVTQKWGWNAIHAPVLIHLSDTVFSRDKFATLLDILEGKISEYNIDEVYPINELARKQKSVEGRLTGGNLTLIQSSIGTCWEVQTKGKILFVEDNNMRPWWIYRSMYHLKESGRLDGVKAIIFGRFVKTGTTQREVGKVLVEFANSIDVPVYVTDQFGHGNHNMPLIYNAKATLHDMKMTISVDEKLQKALAETYQKQKERLEEEQKKQIQLTKDQEKETQGEDVNDTNLP